MSKRGTAYGRFLRALDSGNEAVILSAARQLPRVALNDALRICLVLRDGDSDRYERAAVRWLGRFALEARDVTVSAIRGAAEALDHLPDQPAQAMERSNACASSTGCRGRSPVFSRARVTTP
jgi:hypothetical protein